MALQTQRVSFPFVQGMDTKTDPKILPTGKLVDVRNADFSSVGSIKKRKKMISLPNGVAPWKEYDDSTDGDGTDHVADKIKNIRGIVEHNDSYLIDAEIKDGSTQYRGHGRRSLYYLKNANKWSNVGAGFGLTIESIDRVSFSDPLLTGATYVFTDKYGVILHKVSSSFYLSIIDLSTMSKVIDAQKLLSVSGPQMAVLDDVVYIVGYTGTGASIALEYVSIDLGLDSAIDVSTPVNLVSSGSLYSEFDWNVRSSTDGIWLSYIERTSRDNVVNLYLGQITGTTPTPDATDTLTLTAGTDSILVPITSSSGEFRMMAIYEDSSTYYCQPYDGSCTAVGSPSSLSIGGTVVNITGAREPDADEYDSEFGAWRIFYRLNSGGIYSTLMNFDGSEAYGASAILGAYYNVETFCSDAFTVDGRACILLAYEEEDSFYSVITTVDRAYDDPSSSVAYPSNVVSIARIMNGRAQNTQVGPKSAITGVFGDKVYFVVQRGDRASSDGGLEYSDHIVCMNTERKTYSTSKISKTTVGAGGIMWGFDGNSTFDIGWPYTPDAPTLATAGSGGFLSDGTYNFVIVYEWTDANGEIYRSAVSAAASITLSGGGGSQKVTATCISPKHIYPYLKFPVYKPNTERSAAEDGYGVGKIVLYRTEAGGSTYYRDSDATQTSWVGTPNDEVDIDVGQSDSSLVSQEILYITGGVLDNDPPLASSSITFDGDRAFIDPKEYSGRVHFSKTRTDETGLSFPLTHRKDTTNGDEITAVASLDGKKIVFSKNKITAFGGSGPDSTGSGSYPLSVPIASSVGHMPNTPVLETDMGVFFKSSRGICLLDRSLKTKYIGSPVEKYKDHGILSMALDKNSHRSFFLLDDKKTMLVFDSFLNAWSVYDADGFRSICSTTKGLAGCTESTVYEESKTEFDDKNSLSIKTGWIRLGSIAGYQRVYRIYLMGRFHEGQKINMKIESAVESFSEPQVEEASISVSGSSDWIDFQPANQQCTAVRVTISEVKTPSSRLGMELSGLDFVIGTLEKLAV